MTETMSLKALTRRQLLTRGAAAGASFVIGTGFVAGRDAAWATEMDALKPETMATLIQMARDIYPHDKVGDQYYAAAVKGYDVPQEVDFVQAGIDMLNDTASQKGFGTYLDAGWEDDRVAILREIEGTDFFQRIRGGLVTGLYNQKEVWPIFGYEGESYSKGGYLYRGFDDISWI
ncbi:hypothetical protein ATO8_04926 [Roseivivax marinus]|jgi:hypothetical protein|uniref:Twin-arginine translocation pathway signal n=1 Tax=Roseivivax marinus TaxID=1379903 RepID=W4HNC2_9RHOB|nr:twin-arginine translocation pathway signal [Roseivivax marinus]ETW14209.1 hypothetical protein ATO8_04926 [Roseivivax marinus]UMA63518.1 Twin-arginine translocation pathway signal [Roseivivax marinus]SEL66928.1 hypothetical protein SAMN05444413_11323 [Roseivivax marinus]